MRISDWSSDVCSSDLPDGPGTGRLGAGRPCAGGQATRAGRRDPAVPVRGAVRQHADAVPRAGRRFVPAAAAGAGLPGARIRSRVRGAVRVLGPLRLAAPPRTVPPVLAVSAPSLVAPRLPPPVPR